jgi:RimJ/RimL family protein N-acetyltransferase
MFPEELETERLRLHRFCSETVAPRDLYEAASRHSDTIDEETAHVGWSAHDHVQESRRFLERCEQWWADGDRATYAVVPKETEGGGHDHPQAGDRGGAFAGYTELDVEWDRRSAELGVWLRKRFWGRGYSGERAGALLELAFERLDLEVVAAVHLDGNENARRAIEKYVEEYGGRYEGRLRNWRAPGGDPRDAHRYTISREEYRAATT